MNRLPEMGPLKFMKKTPIAEYVQQLISTVRMMNRDYPTKNFPLDGRLVGDIGEILAEQLYDLELLAGNTPLHDAVSQGRHVQIKTTMKSALGFGDIPDYYLGLKIDENGCAEEIFNGPGSIIWEAIKGRKRPKNYMINVSVNILKKLNSTVRPEDRIPKRKVEPIAKKSGQK